MVDTRPRLACTSCGKRYVVPEATKTYPCKACGGEVRAAQAGETPTPADAEPCRSCGAQLADGSSYCEACGASAESAPDSGARATAERRRAASDLQRSYKSIKLLRVFYFINAAIGALLTGLFVLALADPAADVRGVAVAIAIMTVTCVFMLVGGIQIAFQPFVWAVLLAALVTVNQIITWVQGGFSLIGAVWAAIMWVPVIPTVRARKLVRDHPDLYIAHRIHGTHFKRQGRGVTDQRKLLKQASAKAWRISAIVTGAAIVASTLGSWRVYAAMRPEAFEPVLGSFDQAWNESDFDALGAFFGSSSPGWAERLRAIAAKREWGERLPGISESEWNQSEARARATYTLSGELRLQARWELQGGDWILVELTPPPPPFDSMALDFVAAWNASDVEAMARFSPREKWETMTAAIRRMAQRREWRGFPAVEEASVETLAADHAEVRLGLAGGGAAFVRWKVGDDDSWILTSIKPPAR